MDSMKSLDTSLPRSRRRKHSQPPEQLLQAFKAAALSVTNLYKTAAADEKTAREAGYQEALDDILTFMDRENIGLCDGEGWRIRRWATERLESSPPAAAASDTEEERVETARGARSSSPVAHSATQQDQPRHPSRSASPTHPVSALATFSGLTSTPPVVNNFTFCSHHPYPQEVDMQTPEGSEINLASSPSQHDAITPQAVRLGLVPRSTRSSHRNGRNNIRSTTSGRLSTSATGSKRKLPFLDYFDIGSFGDGKDGQGGSAKRGRFT